MNGHEDLICYDRILVLFRQRVLLASGEIRSGARSTGTGCERFFFLNSEGGEKKVSIDSGEKSQTCPKRTDFQ